MNIFKPLKTIITILFLTVPLVGMCQSKQARSKVEAAKIGLISERMGLTPKQAEQFWPLYREYSDHRKNIQGQIREAKTQYDPNTATDEQTKKLIDLSHSLKQQNLDLQKEYSDKLLQVINNRQLMSLRKAEDDFRTMILNKLEQRRRQQTNRQQSQQRNNERLKNKRN